MFAAVNTVEQLHAVTQVRSTPCGLSCFGCLEVLAAELPPTAASRPMAKQAAVNTLTDCSGTNSSVLSVKVFARQDVRALAVAVQTFGNSRRLQACQTRTSDDKDRGDAT